MRYACIARHEHEHDVRLMCAVLAVSPSGFYASRKRSPCARAIADERLMLNIRIAHEKSDGSYGAPRVQRELQDDGIAVGTKRVARLMRQEGLRGRAPRGWRPTTTDSTHAHPIAPNLLDRQFAVAGGVLNQVWVSDITYVPTRAGWLYLATVLDLASRRVVGWAMRETLDARRGTRGECLADGNRRAPAPAGADPSLGPRQSIRVRGVPGASRRAGDAREHESQRQLLGQCGGGEFLRHARAGVDREGPMGDARCGAPGDLSLYRDVVQPRTAALDPGLRQSRGL